MAFQPAQSWASDDSCDDSGRSGHCTFGRPSLHDSVDWNFRNDALPVMTKSGCNSGNSSKQKTVEAFESP
jgi:hypothetical protein